MARRPNKKGTRAAVPSLADLKRSLLEAEAREAQARAAEKARQEALDQERLALARELADVVPLQVPPRVESPPPRPAPLARQRERDEQEALAASLSDEIDIERYLDTDESMSWAAPQVGADVVPRLRRGAWAIGAQIDLHGLRSDEAREALVAFLEDCRRRAIRCVRVIHGKGLGSANREPVLKDKVRRWLVQRAEVLAFCQTAPVDGGSGAVLVLLAGPRR